VICCGAETTVNKALGVLFCRRGCWSPCFSMFSARHGTA
jgi:hypothetical protein